MKVGDIIVCIDNEVSSGSLTLNKRYIVLELKYVISKSIGISVYDDKGVIRVFNSNRFLRLVDIRESILNELGV